MYKVNVGNNEISLNTAEGIFSPSRADNGTLAMLDEAVALINGVPGTLPLKILDLGCGAGLVGIYLAVLFPGAQILFTDIDQRCVELSLENAGLNHIDQERINGCVSDAFSNVEESDFDLILSNPPYHTDFSVAKSFIEGSFRHLRTGGRLFMVTKRLDWYKNKIISIFGGVRITRTADGYFVFSAEKRGERPAKVKPIKKR